MFGGDFNNILKCAIFEPSIAKRHMIELNINNRFNNSPMVYTIFSGDHRTPFISVKSYYIAHFLNNDMDMLISAITPPGYSVIKSIERIISVLIIGLNSTALARNKMNSEEGEIEVYKLKEIVQIVL